jgi:sugar lactone lactonase YvrE
MRRLPVLPIVRGLGVFAAAAIVTWLALPSPIGSLPWIPSPAPALDGAYRQNDLLTGARRTLAGRIHGAEDWAFDAAGHAYAGLDDGRVVRVDGDTVTDVATTGGRVYGLEFGRDGLLYGCDGVRGLLRIDVTTGEVKVLVDRVEGFPFHFANDLEIASDGVVYFTDSSAVWRHTQFTEDILDQRPSGRVLRFDPRNGETLVLARELSFANGLALSADETQLLVAETGRYRLWRLWLTGDKKNLKEVVLENLPGFPDNLARTPRGTYWVALSSTRKRLLDAIHPYPLLKDAVASLPAWLRPEPVRWGFVVEIDADARPIRSLQDPSGDVVPGVTSVHERDGSLWLGSLHDDGVVRVAVP